MNTTLLIITGVSLLVAVASAALAWRVTRAERQRRAARVAALAAAAGLGVVDSVQASEPLAAPVPRPAIEPIGLEEFMAGERDSRSTIRPTTPAPWAADTVNPSGPVASGALFVPTVAASGSSGRQHWLMGAAGVFAAGVIAFAAIGFWGSRAVAPAGTGPQSPLELVALSHNRVDGALAVAGLVRNPPAGARVEDLEAEVRVFDAAGILIGTRSARVESVSLAPGQEASFAVSLGDLVTAARYRVSFHAAGTMLPHVDRRTHQPAAVTAEAR